MRWRGVFVGWASVELSVSRTDVESAAAVMARRAGVAKVMDCVLPIH
jgi:hypothetical protein